LKYFSRLYYPFLRRGIDLYSLDIQGNTDRLCDAIGRHDMRSLYYLHTSCINTEFGLTNESVSRIFVSQESVSPYSRSDVKLFQPAQQEVFARWFPDINLQLALSRPCPTVGREATIASLTL
jgi:hypothetical protein